MKNCLNLSIWHLQGACHIILDTKAWTSCRSRMSSSQSCKSCTSSLNILCWFWEMKYHPIFLKTCCKSRNFELETSPHFHTMRQIWTTIYWSWVPKISFIIIHYILGENLPIATQNVSFWKATHFARKPFAKFNVSILFSWVNAITTKQTPVNIFEVINIHTLPQLEDSSLHFKWLSIMCFPWSIIALNQRFDIG